MVKDPVRVLVTGAAGQIGYALVPMIARGAMMGPDQPVILHMLDIQPAAEALNGVKMELIDVAFPFLKGVVATMDVVEACRGVNIAVMVGGFPRKEGMERKDVTSKNVSIYKAQASALEQHAATNCKGFKYANQFRKTPLKYEDELDLIFGGTIAQGYTLSVPSQVQVPQPVRLDEDTDVDANVASTPSSPFVSSQSYGEGGHKRKSPMPEYGQTTTSSVKIRKQRSSIDADMQSLMSVMSTTLKNMIQPSATHDTPTAPVDVLIGVCVKLLCKFTDFDCRSPGWLYMVNHVFHKRLNREAFVSMMEVDQDTTRFWVQSRMNEMPQP